MKPRLASRWGGGHARFPMLCSMLFLLLAGGTIFSAEEASHASRFAFGLIGDMPYTPEQEAQFSHLLEALNQAPLAFVVHNGDLKGGGTRCSDELFAHRKAVFQTSQHPFIYLPGDNDWTDCHDEWSGGYDPLERLAKLREVFFQGEQSLGQRTLSLLRQSANPAYAKFRENIRWTYGGVVFVGLHVVGSNNGLGWTPAGDVEFAERNRATLVWLKQAFELAKRERSRGLLLSMHANPRFEDRWPLPPRYLQALRITPAAPTPSGFSDFLIALETEVVAFEKPVVLVHGDSHYFRIDKPLFSATSKRVIEHFTRVETFGFPSTHWVRGIIGADDPQLFSFKPELVQKNLVKHAAP